MFCAAMRERLINRRQQGDLGEASAIEWLTRIGATVLIPLGHSPDYDLVAEVEGRLLRVQVKTSTYIEATRNGHKRFQVTLSTNGGNQSWTGVTRRFGQTRCDLLFVLAGDGRRWLIPTAQIEGETGINLGGPKYSAFEIEPGGPIRELVYGPDQPPLQSDSARGSADVGESGQTVNLVPKLLSGFESHLPHTARSPITPRPRFQPSKYERTPGKNGQAVINQKRRITLPQQALVDAGMRDGDRVNARADGPGRIVLEKAGLPVWAESR
jgi:PD-(D/E)XK endonuclease